MKLIVAGSIGAAVLVAELLAADAEAGRVRVDYGYWTQPIVITCPVREDAAIIAELLREQGVSVREQH